MNSVVLIVPPSSFLFNPLQYPPLGILYIAAVLEQNGYAPILHDLRENGDLSLIPKADFYGVSATTLDAEDAKAIGKHLKGKGLRIIGGVHASNLPQDFVGYYDAIVVGDGERAILRIIEEEKRGLVVGETIKDIDTIPFPARHLLENDRVVNKELWGGYGYGHVSPPATTVISTRGCPYRCAFCANIPQQIRYRSAVNLRTELEYLVNTYECRHFNFLDDHFTLNRKRLKNLIPEVEPLNIGIRVQARADAIDDEICEALVELGCQEVDIGIEHGDNDVLNLMNKLTTVDMNKRAIEMVKSYGIPVKIFIMTGLPGETWETIEKTKEFIIETQPDKVMVTLFIPFPSCPIWKNPEEYGVKILTKDFSKYSLFYPARSVIETDRCSNEELTEHFNNMRNFILSDKWRR